MPGILQASGRRYADCYCNQKAENQQQILVMKPGESMQQQQKNSSRSRLQDQVVPVTVGVIVLPMRETSWS
jgi:hypothetical protein